jgi:hypothetical protein
MQLQLRERKARNLIRNKLLEGSLTLIKLRKDVPMSKNRSMELRSKAYKYFNDYYF